MIESSPLTDWRNLQDRVARIFVEAGYETKVEAHVKTARGTVDVDVLARDVRQAPPLVYLCECKLWKKRVPKTVVHSLQKSVENFGANWGFIISASGFQSGAREATQHSNIRLLSWKEFQETFEPQWIQNFLIPTVRLHAEPLADYAEPINSRVARKANRLSQEAFSEFRRLQDKYFPLALLLSPMIHRRFPPDAEVQLPLKMSVPHEEEGLLGRDLLEATAYRDVMDLYIKRVDAAILEFDAIFGGRV
jgi:hypothetical protein